ncbi:hypothetical protein BT63DRAFT_378097 [Microthyrium microscopicum]|uniref:CENP-V/GFA domain-containing protein n=1 Tax=Microthyrium microscopicum TaxID=703497 RepID=A0A6A6U248_9PEZI|nr:hypothetical protein BT63DRAFT_378097 [Microthyrium microscopicum]
MAESEKLSLTATCQCKAVRIHFTRSTTDRPLNQCLCSICGRYAALWAYYEPSQVQIEGETDIYVRNKPANEGKYLEFHRCKICGCVTHWAHPDKSVKKMGINCRMLDRPDLEKFEIKQEDGPAPR